jgi:hypothetical protein
VAVYRRDYAIFRLPMIREAHALLEDLAAGTPLGAAVSAALKRGARAGPRRSGGGRLTEDQLFKWFREWAGGGIFAGVNLS